MKLARGLLVKKCGSCGEEYIGQTESKFCSMSCARKAQANVAVKSCVLCRRPYRGKNSQRFCSRECGDIERGFIAIAKRPGVRVQKNQDGSIYVQFNRPEPYFTNAQAKVS